MMENQKKMSPELGEDASGEAVIRFLKERGILPDTAIEDAKCRTAKQERTKNAYHNTLLLLKHYRDIAWLMECFPDTIAAELEQPFEKLDRMIESLDIDLSWGNKKMENRLAGIKQTRLLMDRVNEALTVLKKKPDKGQKFYDIIYLTYIAPEVLSQCELLYRLDLSARHYYRFREQAIQVLSLRLWSAPDRETDTWLGLIGVLENMGKQK